MFGSAMPCSLTAFHTLQRSAMSNAFLKSMAATQSGWCHSSALFPSCWNVKMWPVVVHLVSALVGVKRGLLSLEEELAEQFAQGGTGNTWVDSSMMITGPQSCV